MSSIQDKFQQALATIPEPGGGGCHAALLGVANLGIMAGIEPQELHGLIRAAIPQGGRFVPDSEIYKTIKTAMRDCQSYSDYRLNNNSRIPPFSALIRGSRAVIMPDFTQKLIDSAKGFTGVDLWELSPVRLLDDPAEDWRLFIKHLFRLNDWVMTGSTYEKRLDRCSELLEAEGLPGELIGVNPMSGIEAETKDGKPSLFCDAAVKAYRFAVVEFDDHPLEAQMRFWAAVPLPITALIFSGGKSIHALIKLDGVHTPADWDRVVKGELFRKRLSQLGVDTATANPSRTTRTPGIMRDKSSMQRLLYLNPQPDGQPIIKNIKKTVDN
jgi:hypothetical protein